VNISFNTRVNVSLSFSKLSQMIGQIVSASDIFLGKYVL